MNTSSTGGSTAHWSMQSPPFVMLKENGEDSDGVQRFEGFCVALLDKLSELLKFKYQLHLVEDGRYGTEPEPGRWTGMIGELVDGVSELRFEN